MNKKLNSKKFLVGFSSVFLIYILFISFRSLRHSFFFQNRGRVNVVIYGEKPVFFSIGLGNPIHYFLSFFPDLQVAVPGRYGVYRMGALSKLVALDKKPEIFKRTFSSITSSLVDFYFYPGREKGKIYFGDKSGDFYLPNVKDIFTLNSNASIFDRIYLYYLFLGKNKNQFRIIDYFSHNSSEISDLHDEFYKEYRGYFYDEVFRGERKKIQIRYRSFATALMVADILEGGGIRVVDVSEYKVQSKKNCLIMESGSEFSHTSKAMSNFFGCELGKNQTGVYDIIIELGSIESDWEVD